LGLADRRGLPPGPRGLPLLGNMRDFDRDTLGFLTALQRSYGRIATFRYGQTPLVVVFDPALIRLVLAERPRSFSSAPVVGGLVYGQMIRLLLGLRITAGQSADPLVGLFGEGGLITGDGELHDRLRHAIQPAFSRRGVALLMDAITEYTEDAMRDWRAGQVIDILHEMRELTLRVIFTVLLGQNLGEEFYPRRSQLVAELQIPGNLLAALRQWMRRPRANGLDAMLDAFIARRMDGDPGTDVLWLLLSGGFSRQHIRDAILSLIAAGHETTTGLLVWTFHLLAQEPAVFDRLRRELGEVLAGSAPAGEDMHRLVYLEQVMKESMRLYPPGWVIGRIAREDVMLDGFLIPSGTRLLISQPVSHRNPDLWSDPDSFAPERWDPERAEHRPQGEYYPFGVGRRICPGKSLSEMEATIVLSIVLQRFYPRMATERRVMALPSATLKPVGPVLVRLEPAGLPESDPARDEALVAPVR